MRIISLASGSKANSFLLDVGENAILIDAGLSGKKTLDRLSQTGVVLQKIKGILVTHEHKDHIAGLSVLNKKHKIPLYVNKKTYLAIKNKIKGLSNVHFFDEHNEIYISELYVKAIPVLHDAVNPVAFLIEYKDKKMGIATDLGKITNHLKVFFHGIDVLIIEANHDQKMLMNGSYSWDLKQRIASERGHLSNAAAGEFIKEIATEKLKVILLAHLSEENNRPNIAYKTINSILENVNLNIPITVCEQYSIGKWIDI